MNVQGRFFIENWFRIVAPGFGAWIPTLTGRATYESFTTIGGTTDAISSPAAAR